MKSAGSVNYTFDGSGERVQDSSPKLYWYGRDGTVLAETDTSGNAVNEYVFFDGMRIARRDGSGNVYYYFGINPLGSAAITTASGSICYDADFYPFGGELAFTNTCAQNYKFAGMERDSPSGLDRTIFRQYSSNYGRWLSPDPYYGSYDTTNPQTLNRYAYVANNPTNYFDPLGLDHVIDVNGCFYLVSASYMGWDPQGDAPIIVDSEAALGCMPDASVGSCPTGTVCYSQPGGGSNGSGPGGAVGGGGVSSNSYFSSTFLKSWWKDVKNCVGNYGIPTLQGDLNPIPSGDDTAGVLGSLQSAADQAKQNSMLAVGAYSVGRGLTVPLRSSVVRGGLKIAESLGKASDVLLVGVVGWAGFDAIREEWNNCL